MKEVQVDKFFGFLKNELNYSELTIKSYQLDLTDFFRFLGKSKKNYLNINNEDVRDYLKYLDSCKLKNSTISRRISTLRTFYNYLLDEGKVSSNIFKNVKNPKLEKKLPNYLNYNEMEELLNSIDTSTIEGLERRLLIEMFYSTGCRVSEIINIKIKDIDFTNNTIRIMGKGSKERIVYYGDYASNYMKSYLSKRKCNKYLFENKSILNIEPSLLILNTCTSSSIPSDTNAIVLPTSKLNLLYPI